MNKDVIYIEPEDDITDILANIKAAKNKIVALVPPKKAGVLRSAVNFKLIAKTGNQTKKAIVLITADESLSKLAASVRMPVAKTLQSKPQIPDDAAVIAARTKEEDIIEAEPEAEAEAKKTSDTSVKPVAKDENKEEAKSDEKGSTSGVKAVVAKDGKKADSKDGKKLPIDKTKIVPKLEKHRLKIIIGAVAALVLVLFLCWANIIAPKADIVVTIKTNPQNFAENITFVTEEDKQDIESGVFYIEQRTISKTADVEFEATGEKNMGEKATGTITVYRHSGDSVSCSDRDQNMSYFSIPEGTVVKINGKEFITTEGASVNVDSFRSKGGQCYINEDASSGAIGVIAANGGADYNLDSSTDASLTVNTSKKYTIASSAMTGGTDKKVRVVKEEDAKKAESSLNFPSQSDLKKDLAAEFTSDYILIDSSFKTEEGSVSVTPNKDEEVAEGVTPKVVKENKYTIYAVKREALAKFIEKKVMANSGDDTQELYETGVGADDKNANAFIESFRAETMSARLKGTAQIGPKVTEDDVREKSLGKKIGEVQRSLKSINGVTNVDIKTSYFWVMKVPKEDKKVTIEIKFEN